jgi:hypothetical protein
VNADVVVRDLYKTQRSRPLVQFVTSMPAVRIPAVVGEGGLEPLPLPAEIPIYLQVRSVSFQFSPTRYLRFRSQVLTASRVIAPFPIRSVQHA